MKNRFLLPLLACLTLLPGLARAEEFNWQPYRFVPQDIQYVVGRRRAASGPPVTLNLIQWVESDLGTYSDTGLTTAQTTNGGTVKGWKDQTANAHNFTQTAACLLETSQVNGNPSLRFNGSSNYLVSTYTLNAPFTIFIVFKQITWVTSANVLCGASGDNLSLYQSGGSPKLTVWGGSTGGTATNNPAVGTWAIVSINDNSGNVNYRLNANASENLAGDSGAKSGLTIAAHPGPASFGNVDVAMILVYSSSLNSTDETTVRNWINAKYAIF